MTKFSLTAVAVLIGFSTAAAAQEDWTGPYAGVQLGAGTFDSENRASLNDRSITTYGVHVGYQHDLGNVVLGGELQLDRIDGFGGPTGDSILIKGRVGYDFGKIQPYAMVTHHDVDDNDGVGVDGIGYGVGVEYMVNDKIRVGAEYLGTPELDDGQGVDGDHSTFQLRLSYGF